MFNLSQIKAAHAHVKTGSDFPHYIQNLIKLGVKKYETFVADGHTCYSGDGDYQIQSQGRDETLTVADKSDKERFRHYLESHQKGQTDYSTFCKHAAETGVEKWTVETSNMTCTYFDKYGNKMLQEQIPAP